MKKLNNLIVHCASSIVHQSKTLTLLLVMLMSVNLSFAETWEWTPSQNSDLGNSTSEVTVTLNQKTWKANFTNASRTLQSNPKALQIGAKDNVAIGTLKSSDFANCTITKVTITCASYQAKHKVAISVGGKQVKAATATGSWTKLDDITSGTISEEGEIVFTVSQSSGRAFYISKITIEYTPKAANPVTSIILSEAGVTSSNLVNGEKIGDEYTLRTTCSQTCGDKTFVGWSTGEVNSPTEPTSNFYAPGAQVELAKDNIFYAVFADEGEGGGEEIVETVGFESSEGYTAQSTYNSNSYYTGTKGSKWTINYGAFSTNNAIIGSQSAQFRIYSAGNYGQLFNSVAYAKDITKVVFSAMGANSDCKVKVSYSTNKSSWTDIETKSLTTTTTEYTVTVPVSGVKYIKFTAAGDKPSSGNFPIHVDGVKIYSGGGKSYSNYTTTCSSSSCSIEPELMIDEAISKTTADVDFSLEVLSDNVGASQTIVLNSSNTNVATIVDGKIHIVGAGTTDITASVAADGEYCSATSNTCVLTVSKAKYTVTWMASGVEFAKNENVEDGSALTLPSPAPTSSDCDDKKVFRGWTTEEEYSNATAAPADMFTTAGNKKVTGNVTYYAVFSDATPGGAPVTATLSATGLTAGTYKEGSKKDDKNNLWSYYASVNNQSGTLYFGLNADDKNYHIASPLFSGKITAISMKAWNGSSTEVRNVLLCSDNTTAKPANGDIAEISIAKSEQLTTTYEANLTNAGEFSQFYIYVKKPLGVNEIAVTYSPITYSNYTTVCTPPTYSITFDGNGATLGEMSKIENIAKGGSQTLPQNKFEKIGYTFNGWKDQDDNEVTDKATIDNITKNITLTAQWTAKLIEVTLDKNGSSEDGEAIIVYDATSIQAGFIEHVADWAAHELQGYFTESTGGSKVLNADGTFAGNVAGWIADGKWAQAEDATLYAQWLAQQKCTFTDYDLDGCTADPNNVTEVDVNAEGVTLNYILADNHTWEGSETYITMGTADLEEGTDYTFETGTITFLNPITGNINVMISCPWAPATLTLSAIEHEYPFGENLKVNDEITLPSTVNYQASGKTFVGWSSDPIPTEGSAPSEKYWAKGAKYTIQSATDKLYAVYATENKGAESWNVATSIDAGDVVVISTHTEYTEYPMKTAGDFYTTGSGDKIKYLLGTTASTYNEDKTKITSLADRTIQFLVGGTTGAYTLMRDGQYLAMVGDKSINFQSDESTWAITFNGNVATVSQLWGTQEPKSTYKLQYNYNQGTDRFVGYTGNMTAISLYKKHVEPSTFNNYTTSGSIHVDAPTFDNDTKPGTYTDAEHLVMINVPTNATVRYTLDGNEPTEASVLYDENEGITLTATATIKAKAFIEGTASEMLEGLFTIHNYNTVAALINGAEHNKAAVLNLNEVYVLGVYSLGKQIFIQEGTKGTILTLTDAIPEEIKAGVKLTATVSGTYIYTDHNRPQMNGCTLSSVSVSVSGESQRPASIPVLSTIDDMTAADNLLTLVQINDVYSISKSYNDIVMNSASDGTGTSYNVNNLLSAVKNTLPEKELACNVIGIFYKKISNNVEEYSIVPVLESDFALVGDAPDAELPVVDFVGGTQAAPIEVAVDKKITITKPSTGFNGSYSFNGAEAVSMTASSYQVQITNTTAAESLTLTSTRPYYKDNSVTYYYVANPALNEYAITYPLVQTYVGITGVASAIPGTDVVMTGTRKKEHYYPGDVTVTRTDDETVKIDVTRTEVSATEATYSFKMPTYPVTVQIGYTKDPTYSITYQTGGKQTTSGSAPTEGVKYEDEEVTLKPNTWTVNNFTFDKWKVVYETGDAEPKEQHEVEVIDGKFIMPPYNVKVIAQWVAVYAVTYAKGTATSATGSVTEEPQKEGAVITLKANAFKATGYSFTGWKASTNEQIYQPDAEFTMPAQAVTFTAQWDVAEYKKDGTWELVTSADQLEIGKFYVIGNSQYGKTMTSTSAGTTNKRLTAVETVYSDDKVEGDKGIIKKSDLPEETVIFQLGKESEAWTFMNVATEQYYHTGDHSNPEWLTTENKALWSLTYNSTTLTMKAIHGSYTSDSTLQYYHNANASSCGFRPYTSSQKAIRLYRFYPTARKVYFSANAGEDAVTDMPDWQRADHTTNEVTIPNVTPKRTGYTFTEWNSNAQGGGVHSAQPNETIELWQAECTLHAIWTKNTPLLTVANVEHGTIQAKPNSMADIYENGSANVEYQKSVVISHTDDDEEYAFKTWKITKTGDESVVITPTVGKTSVTFDMPDYPVTVSAIYESKTSIEYTLTYDANGGEGTMTGNPFTQHWNDYITVSNNKDGDNDIFTKTLCTFDGWNTKADGTGASYAAGAHFYMKSDVTLYAQWKGSGATYRLDKNYDGNIYVNIGAAPQGSTATCVNTNESAQIDQATMSNSITITLTGYAGKVIKNITAEIKANSSSNSGKLDITVGGINVFDKTYEDLGAQNKSQYQERSFADYGFGPVLVKENEDIVILVRSLVDKSAYIQNITIEYVTPDYTRTFSNSNVSTVCVPYAVKPEDRFGAQFYEIAYKEAADDYCKIYFDEVAADETLVAGKPYVIIPEGGTLALIYSGSKVTYPVDGEKGLTGTFVYINDDAVGTADNILEGNYIFSQNKYWLCKGNCGLDPYRAYIKKSVINADFTPVAPVPGRRRISMGTAGLEDVDTSGNTEITTGTNEIDAERIVRKMIINNKMYILRAGKMYNAAGALMK